MSYSFDIKKEVAGIEIFPKGDYEFKVGEPKPFAKKNDDDTFANFGVRVALVIAEPAEYENKKAIYSNYMHFDGAGAFTKQFIMACLGYGKSKSEEERFNQDHGDEDWGFDPEGPSLGDAWKQLEGQRVIGSMTIQKNNKTGEPMQNFGGWRAIGSK